MQTAFATIPVRSERQAMDWSLVLVSQGIEATIERNAEANAWHLVVNSPDYLRAVQAIRQYKIENPNRIWRQELPWTGLIFDWRCVLPMLFLVFLFVIVHRIVPGGDCSDAVPAPTPPSNLMSTLRSVG